MILSLCLYSAACLISALIIYNGNKRGVGIRVTIGNHSNREHRIANISVISIVIISLLFTLYNYYITVQAQGSFGGDRLNYTAYFNGIRAFSNQGLGYVMQFVKNMGGSIYTVFYVTTFISILITLFAFRISEDYTPTALCLLLVSQYIMITFTALKQAYTNAFAGLFFLLLLSNNESKKKNIICIGLIILAILFHPSGIILIPFYIFLRGEKKALTIAMFIISLLVIAIFMQPIMNIAAGILRPVSPALSAHIGSYFGEAKTVVRETSPIAFVKGFPCYIIAFLGISRRNTFKGIISNYDNYLIISIACSFFYLVGSYTAWFFRFSYLMFLPTFTYFGLLMKNTTLSGNRIVYKIIVFLSMIVVTYREIALVYLNWGGVW